MKTATPALLAMLNGAGNAYVMADLYTLTLIGGQVLRYTDFDLDLTAGGNVYASASLKFKRSRVRWIAGLEVDTLDISIFASTADLLNGLPFLAQVERGVLDGASLKLERGWMNLGSTVAETLTLFNGRVAEVQVSRTEARIKIKSDLELLNVRMPRNLYTPGCLYTLYDTGCGISRAAYAVNGSVTGGANRTWFPSALTHAANWFDLGTVTFTSGANNGITRTVRDFTSGAFLFSQPWPNVPAIGDTFTAWPGCDKSQATCTGKFANKTRFRGFPYIPVPETSM